MLSKNILATIVYYDCMNYPLTAFEIFNLMIELEKKENEKNISLGEVVMELEKGSVLEFVDEYQGFFFLKGRKNLVSERIEKNKLSDQKLKKIIKQVSVLRWVPFLRSIMIAGRVAMKNSVPESDFDLLLIMEKGHIFSGRFFSFLVLSILGRRRHDKKIKDRICLNHYLAEKSVVSIKDIFSSHEYVFLLPIFGFEVYADFLKKNTQWLSSYRPYFENEIRSAREINDTYLSRKMRKLMEKIFGSFWLEKKLEEIQIKKIKRNPKTKNEGGIIICSREELAFWPEFQKQGPRIFEKFQNKIANLKNNK